MLTIIISQLPTAKSDTLSMNRCTPELANYGTCSTLGDLLCPTFYSSLPLLYTNPLYNERIDHHLHSFISST